MKFLKMDQNWFYLIKQASDISKIKLSFIIYACCLNKTTKTINKLTNEQPSSHFFWLTPYIKSMVGWFSKNWKTFYIFSVFTNAKVDKGSVKKKWVLGCSFVNLLIVFIVLFKQHAWIMNENMIFDISDACSIR